MEESGRVNGTSLLFFILWLFLLTAFLVVILEHGI